MTCSQASLCTSCSLWHQPGNDESLWSYFGLWCCLSCEAFCVFFPPELLTDTWLSFPRKKSCDTCLLLSSIIWERFPFFNYIYFHCITIDSQTSTSFWYSWNHWVSPQILWGSRSFFISIIYTSIYLNLSPCIDLKISSITVDQQSTSFGVDEFSLRVLSIEMAESADATSNSVAVRGAHFSGGDWWSEKWREWKSMMSLGKK